MWFVTGVRSFVLTVVFWLVYIPLSAAEQGLFVGMNTYHLSGDSTGNEQNQILALQQNRWLVSHYINSYSDTSWAVAYQTLNSNLAFANRLNLSGSIWIGAATGYGDRLQIHWGPLTFTVLPEVEFLIDISKQWQIGVIALYIWTERGGVVIQGGVLKYQFRK